MKNNETTIKQLLDKFYEAETTEQEEKTLKEYFCSSDVAPEFESYRAQFEFYEIGYDDGKSLSLDFDDKLMREISKTQIKPTKRKTTNLMWYASLAATFLIAFGLFYFTRTTTQVSESDYAQAVDAFILISEKMDLASVELQNLQAIEDSFDELDAFKLLENYGKHLNNK